MSSTYPHNSITDSELQKTQKPKTYCKQQPRAAERDRAAFSCLPHRLPLCATMLLQSPAGECTPSKSWSLSSSHLGTRHLHNTSSFCGCMYACVHRGWGQLWVSLFRGIHLYCLSSFSRTRGTGMQCSKHFTNLAFTKILFKEEQRTKD